MMLIQCYEGEILRGRERKGGQKHIMLIQCYEGETLRGFEEEENNARGLCFPFSFGGDQRVSGQED